MSQTGYVQMEYRIVAAVFNQMICSTRDMMNIKIIARGGQEIVPTV